MSERPGLTEAEVRANLIQTKTEIMTRSGEAETADLGPAAEKIDQMIQESGSLLSVYTGLEAEAAMQDIGIDQQFFDRLDAIMADSGFADRLSQLQRSVLESCKDASGKLDFGTFLDQVSSRSMVEIRREILQDRQITDFLEAHTDDPRVQLCLEQWSMSNQLSLKFQIANECFVACKLPPQPPAAGIDENSLRIISDFEVRKIAILAAAADPPPPPSGSGSMAQTPEPQRTTSHQLLTASPEADPPPPLGPGGEYQKVIPENLKDVQWPNGDSIHFEYAETKIDDQGRERRFYTATLHYLPIDSLKFVTINLSEYIPGKKIIYEGTSGSLTGATMDPDKRKEAGAWAMDNATEDTTYMTALNQEYMQDERYLDCIFHEMGHSYLYGDAQKQLLAKDDRNLFERILKKPRKVPKAQPIRGIENYQAEIGKLRNVARLGILDPKLTRAREILAKGENVSNAEFRQLINSGDELNIGNNIHAIRSVFHERNAGAFGIKQIRKLRPRVPSPREALESERYNLTFRTKSDKDPRFSDGIQSLKPHRRTATPD